MFLLGWLSVSATVVQTIKPPEKQRVTESSRCICLGATLEHDDTISSQTSHPTGDLHSQWLTFMASTIFLLHPFPLCLRLTGSLFFPPRPTGTYLTHEAKGSDDAPDADTAIINAEGGHSGAEEKKEYFI